MTGLSQLNHYPHHIGDFDKATRHLSRIERSIYRDLIELYYDTETQLTLDMVALCRRILARTNEETTAVEQTLNEFFNETPTGWYHSRCELEIEKYQANASQKAQAGKASAAAKLLKIQQASNGNATDVEQPLNGNATDVEQPLNGNATDVEQTNNGTSTNRKPLTVNQEPEKSKPLSGKPDSPAPKIPKLKINGAETAEVISYLNEKAGTSFRMVEANTKLIAARMRDGATIDDCKRVVDFKVSEWGRDSKMREYLRPATLFNAEKFAQYAGQLAVKAQAAERPFVC